MIPPVSSRGDTLFGTLWASSNPDCVKLTPWFIPVELGDTIQLTDTKGERFLYRSIENIITPIGTFSDNIIYNSFNSIEMIIHESVGVIQLSMYLHFPDGIRKRRRWTLKDYQLHN